MGDWRENYKTVRSELQQLRLPIGDPPAHLVWRIVALLGDEALRHIDSDLSPTSSPRLCSGSVVAFTDSRVIRASLTDAPVQLLDDGATFTTHVETWSRAGLQRLQMFPAKEPSWRNSDAGWSNLFGAEVGAPNWPTDMSVTLEYDQRPPFTLPLVGRQNLGVRTGMLFDFLPELLSDIAKTT
jgi:hypothetical protein